MQRTAGGKLVKKAILTLFVIVITLTLILTSIPFNARAENGGEANFTIEHVNHTIKLLYDGHVFITDALKIIGQEPDGAPSLANFLIGLPYRYGPHVLRCIAYNASNIKQRFQVKLDVPLNGRVGFYGVEISFRPALNLSSGATYDFTVGFLLSTNLLSRGIQNYTLGFPEYPSLTKKAMICDASIVSPNGTEIKSYSKSELPEFTCSSTEISFPLEGDPIRIVNIRDLKREIRINRIGEIEASDAYYITNEASEDITSIQIILPPNSSNQIARDQFGRLFEKEKQPILTDGRTNRYEITFPLPIKANESNRFTINYRLPWESYTTQAGSNNFNLSFPSFKNINYYIERSSVTFVLPEGAKVLNFEAVSHTGSCDVARDVFQERVTINSHNVISLDSFDVRITYEYNLLWLSFRPTLWMWALAIIGCVGAVVWKRPKASAIAAPTVAVRLRPESVKAFVDLYEQKSKTALELESLETKARKGKIPRRRYKVRKRA
ncbi:hypothetical protein KAU30_01115, partial [Candidatus Bathyarchaeota archaeon]|nr:hypothetical protein [Candidatus Bathyarchaeota archaeon]